MGRVYPKTRYAGFTQYNQMRRNGHHARPKYGSKSLMEELAALLVRVLGALRQFGKDGGRRMASALAVGLAESLRVNVAPARLLSFPHFVVVVWVVVLLWGERWVFESAVDKCRWGEWEKWAPGANPHRVAVVADPQLIDPHSYPGRPWPVNDLTMLVTDNYMRRSYNQIQNKLKPDSIFFLGDLFDGGREWKTARGEFKDPEWGPHPVSEQKYLRKWNKKYGEFYWLKEYARFGDIFLRPWLLAGRLPGTGRNRRKLVASLPGNHDLGFGSQIKLGVRDRYEAFFGPGNRVDVVGNHTFVSVDTVSLSAGSSAERDQTPDVYRPTEQFLNDLQRIKKKAVARELRAIRGEIPEGRMDHKVEQLDTADFNNRPKPDPAADSAELPTILLSHVPLFRVPGTPCGPLREHWPPTKPPKEQTGPVIPDHRNAIPIAAGYQYQNVLSEADSIKLVDKVGNIVHAFSGDDHDYCELKHAETLKNVPEITVKSISMAMGVPTPGFLLVSLFNPINEQGEALSGPGKPTVQTHLCLLPKQLSTYTNYAILIVLSLIALAVRASLVPVLKLTPFALDPLVLHANSALLPVFKEKLDDKDEHAHSTAGFSASRYRGDSTNRARGYPVAQAPLNATSLPMTPVVASPQRFAAQARNAGSRGYKDKQRYGKWGWSVSGNGKGVGPRIEIGGPDEDVYHYGHKWKPAARWARPLSRLRAFVRELWATAFRVGWMVVGLWGYLAWKG